MGTHLLQVVVVSPVSPAGTFSLVDSERPRPIATGLVGVLCAVHGVLLVVVVVSLENVFLNTITLVVLGVCVVCWGLTGRGMSPLVARRAWAMSGMRPSSTLASDPSLCSTAASVSSVSCCSSSLVSFSVAGVVFFLARPRFGFLASPPPSLSVPAGLESGGP